MCRIHLRTFTVKEGNVQDTFKNIYSKRKGNVQDTFKNIYSKRKANVYNDHFFLTL